MLCYSSSLDAERWQVLRRPLPKFLEKSGQANAGAYVNTGRGSNLRKSKGKLEYTKVIAPEVRWKEEREERIVPQLHMSCAQRGKSGPCTRAAVSYRRLGKEP